MRTLPAWRWVIQIGTAVLLITGIVSAVLFARGRAALAKGSEEASETPRGPSTRVKTVHPVQDANFQITVERPADVEAYYRSRVESQVAGKVTYIHVAPGSWVEKGDKLVEIFRPDLGADKREKGNIVKQREREMQLAQAKTEAARVAVKTALAHVEKEKTLLRKAQAETRYRKQLFDRLEDLWASRTIDKGVRDDAERNLEVARAGEADADAARVEAESKVADAEANVKVMEAEVDRARQLIEVDRSNFEQATAQFEYTHVKAPIRGRVVKRHVDPGSFVQDASTGHPTSLVTLERTDIMTVVMHVPDNYAPFVTAGTEAVIELDALPGIKIHGKVTRFPQSLDTVARDRTMRVEVDLWNGTPEEYQKLLANPGKAELKDGPLPLIPEYTGQDHLKRSRHLIADMYGKMTLYLKTFDQAYLIPSQAILRQGGRTHVYLVQEGKAHLIPVLLQVDDGHLAKVVRLGDKGEVLGDLTGQEEVIVSNQEELTEGQAVETTPTADWETLNHKKAGH